MDKQKMTRKEGKLVRAIRDTAGVIGLIGVGLLAGYALLDLRPGWEWTQEQNEEQLRKEADGSP